MSFGCIILIIDCDIHILFYLDYQVKDENLRNQCSCNLNKCNLKKCLYYNIYFYRYHDVKTFVHLFRDSKCLCQINPQFRILFYPQ